MFLVQARSARACVSIGADNATVALVRLDDLAAMRRGEVTVTDRAGRMYTRTELAEIAQGEARAFAASSVH